MNDERGSSRGVRVTQEGIDPWVANMRRGDFEAAWRVSAALLQARDGQSCHHWPRHQQYIWDGTALAGQRVLIRCYHGLGDTLQFIRYAPLVKAVAAEVLVWAQPELLGLLRGVKGIDGLFALHDGAPEMDYDVDVEVMELPFIFRTTLATIPRETPYIATPPSPARAPQSSGLNVGIVWSAGGWDERRSVPVSAFMPLVQIRGVKWHVLQRGPAVAAWPRSWGQISGSETLLGLAQTMQTLDLVISVDSMPAHLAGALGIPVWTLLMADPDWRWMRDRRDSPWYPTMRLFRQLHSGLWAGVIDDVARELNARCRAPR